MRVQKIGGNAFERRTRAAAGSTLRFRVGRIIGEFVRHAAMLAPGQQRRKFS